MGDVVVQGKGVNEYGDGVAWFRGSVIGKGGFGCVYMATLKNPRSKHSYFPSVMAVKSAEVSVSGSIQKEREVFSNVKGCPNIIKCFGDETTMGDNGMMVYNLLLEYGSCGTLAQRVKNSGSGGLLELEAREYARCILRGLKHIHGIGYVHCDLKPDNILLLPSFAREGTAFRAKIGDFGLAKRVKHGKKRKLGNYWRGTPMYLSPEAVMDRVQESPCDIWALGCIVLEMLTGKPPWQGETELKAEDILGKIGMGQELPKIPDDISKEARDFLKGCFVRKSMFRMTADMLLIHPFIGGLEDNEAICEFVEEPLDLNEIESILVVSESDYESCPGLFSDESGYTSDRDSFSCWSDEDVSYFGDKVVSDFAEGEVEVEKLDGITNSSIDAGLSQLTEASSEVSPRKETQFPVSFTISTGV